MVLFEKYLSNETNLFMTIYFMFRLKLNSTIRHKFDNYEKMSNDLKNMFLINMAENEIKKDKSLKGISKIVDICMTHEKKETDVLNILDRALIN